MKQKIDKIKFSLKAKLLLPILICGAFLSVIGILSIYWKFEDQLLAKTQHRAELLANVINYAAESYTRLGELRRIVAAISADREVESITIVGGNPIKVIAATNQALVGKTLDQLPREDVAEDLEKAINTRKAHFHHNKKSAHFDYTIPLLLSQPELADGSLVDGAVMVHLDTSKTEDEVLKTAIIYSLCLLITLGTLICFVYLQLKIQILRPISNIGMLAQSEGSYKETEWRKLRRDDEIGILSDVIQKSLKQLQEFRFALDEHSIVSITDVTGKIIYVNDKFCEISKYSREELIGKDHFIVNSGVHPSEFMKDLWKTIASGKVWRGAICNKNKFGEEYWVQSTIVPFLDEKGKPIQYISVRTDITNQIKQSEHLQSALIQAEAATYAKGQFLANMSHEIRTPLTSIIGFAEAAKEENVSNKDRIKSFETILKNGKHLLGVINDILDLSKIDAGALKIERLPFCPVNIVENIKLLMVPRLAEKNLSLIISYKWPLPRTICSDSLRLMQILVNLVSNALKFTESGSVEISVWCDKQAQRLYFDIIDSGIGLTEEQISRIFKPFSQADEGTARRYGGTGLGLSISNKLVERLGGKLSVTSTPNIGSTFSFYIDTGILLETEWITSMPSDIEEHKKSERDPSQLSGKILIADDAKDNRDLLAFTLRKSNLDIKMVEDGQQVIDCVNADKFDLILLDMQMPVMDGYDTCRKLREMGLKIPIIAFTANTMKQDVLKCIESGCTTHISKPFRKDELFECLYQNLKHNSYHRSEESVVKSIKLSEDPEMYGLVIKFVSGLEERIAKLSKALSEQDFEQLSKNAHQLSGSAGLFGYPNLSNLGSELESAALMTKNSECNSLVAEIKNECASISRGVT